jgi:hypothetical protein
MSTTEELKLSDSPTTPELFHYLDRVHDDQVEWNTTLYRTANEKLYSLLGSCLKVMYVLSSNKKLKKELDAKLTSLTIPYNAGTHLSTKIVRYVFRISNKRANAYARVVQSAFEHKKSPDNLPSWITQEGGIEAIRLNTKGPSKEEIRERIEQTSTVLHEAEADLTIDDTPRVSVDETAEHPYALGLARIKDGKTEFVYWSTNASLIRQFLQVVGKQVLNDNEARAAEDEAADKLATQSAIIAEAVQPDAQAQAA